MQSMIVYCMGRTLNVKMGRNVSKAQGLYVWNGLQLPLYWVFDRTCGLAGIYFLRLDEGILRAQCRGWQAFSEITDIVIGFREKDSGVGIEDFLAIEAITEPFSKQAASFVVRFTC